MAKSIELVKNPLTQSIALIALIVGQLGQFWLQQQFITRKEYEASQQQIKSEFEGHKTQNMQDAKEMLRQFRDELQASRTSLWKELNDLNKNIHALDIVASQIANNSKRIEDHETRLRTLENHRP